MSSISLRNILDRLRHFGPYLPAVNYRGRRIHGHGNKRHVLSSKGRKIYKFHYAKPVRARKAKPFNVVLVRDKLGRARHFGPYVPAVNYRGRRIHGHGNKRHVLSAKGRKIYKFHYAKPVRVPKAAAAVSELSAPKAASVIKHMSAPKAANLLKHVSAPKVASVITKLPNNKANNVMQQLPNKKANRVMNVLSPLRTPGGRTPNLSGGLFGSAAKSPRVLSPLRTPGGRTPNLSGGLFATVMRSLRSLRSPVSHPIRSPFSTPRR